MPEGKIGSSNLSIATFRARSGFMEFPWWILSRNGGNRLVTGQDLLLLKL